MHTLKITRNGVVTIPVVFRRSLGLREGDYLRAELKDGAIIIKPVKIIDAEDAWFYTKEWQAMEAEADKDIAEGRVSGPFSTIEEFKRDLEKDED